jgi:outer membrane protein assembly factor BamC
MQSLVPVLLSQPMRVPVARLTIASLASVAAVVVLNGCAVSEGLAERNKIDYKSASKVPQAPLDIPPDLTSIKSDERFNIPNRDERTFSAFEKNKSTGASTKPAADSTLLQTNSIAKIERSGSQRWLTVALPPDKVWPVLREFWQESGFSIDAENQGAAILETNWAENRAKLPQDWLRRQLGKVLDGVYSTSERDKFRSRIERGAVAESTEIYISHRGMIEVYKDNISKAETVWQPRPNDPELEVEFLQRLLEKLGATNQQAKTTVAGVVQEDKARLTASSAGLGANTNVVSQIKLTDPFDRAWRRVGLALDRSGFTVEDRDRTQGLYFVRYVDPEVEINYENGKKPGFFGRLLTQEKPFTPSQYRIRLASDETSKQTQVNVLAKDGKEISDKSELRTANKIMAVLLDQLK